MMEKEIIGYVIARYFDDVYEKTVSSKFDSEDEAKQYMYKNCVNGCYVSYEVKPVFKDISK
jgi:hypothetical protein